ncbi:hypothetical protein B6V73_02730 [Thioclava sp. JM3]|uniref:DUF1499 domain-containing protein n=1 Tax=unclassified Thioclava TaxID=2621713 RepID=UPI000B53B006|nr:MULTISPECIES: DUF1499 domain-containing protein [unclassified Thioclava]OWY04748.1 hypothetical protein B6V75_00945 [Thioclava sp. F1Mire-8]OWY07974.1 hypothetical protein B6V74_15485 [Thioclava sp. F42-5]OWY15140.1 hypothetical protein B6V72_00630 [Thioclava sp. F34-6]OWY18720.1 hypothetical protein B6V73_02730 [Thioclava sp. JM3]PWE50712.1 DUF1499 domain-containing protein [Thioclava sp. NG1]
MKRAVTILALGLAVVVAADGWVRLAPIDPARFDVDGLAKAPGDHPETGGFQAVRDVSDPPAQMAALDKIIRGTARTKRVAGSADEGYAAYVTRSAVWGFPDVTTLWIEGDTLQIRGHLVYGKSDLGVNEARIKGWLDEVGL